MVSENNHNDINHGNIIGRDRNFLLDISLRGATKNDGYSHSLPIPIRESRMIDNFQQPIGGFGKTNKITNIASVKKFLSSIGFAMDRNISTTYFYSSPYSEDISKSPVVEIEVNQDAYPKRVEGAKPLWSTVWRKPTKMQRQSQRFLAPSYSYKGNMANDIHPYLGSSERSQIAKSYSILAEKEFDSINYSPDNVKNSYVNENDDNNVERQSSDRSTRHDNRDIIKFTSGNKVHSNNYDNDNNMHRKLDGQNSASLAKRFGILHQDKTNDNNKDAQPSTLKPDKNNKTAASTNNKNNNNDSLQPKNQRYGLDSTNIAALSGKLMSAERTFIPESAIQKNMAERFSNMKEQHLQSKLNYDNAHMSEIKANAEYLNRQPQIQRFKLDNNNNKNLPTKYLPQLNEKTVYEKIPTSLIELSGGRSTEQGLITKSDSSQYASSSSSSSSYSPSNRRTDFNFKIGHVDIQIQSDAIQSNKRSAQIDRKPYKYTASTSSTSNKTSSHLRLDNSSYWRLAFT